MIDYAREVETLKVPAKKKTSRPGKNTVYQFKVTLKNIRPAIWRRIQVGVENSLDLLAATVLIVMGWKMRLPDLLRQENNKGLFL
jgi:hypothetical protein